MENLKNMKNIASISLQAILSTPSPKTTMRFVGQINKRKVVILINTGSTHNFVDTAVVDRCGLVVHDDQPIQVRVANGEVLNSKGGATTMEI